MGPTVEVGSYAVTDDSFGAPYIESHRHGDTNATACRIPNLASARVVVA